MTLANNDDGGRGEGGHGESKFKVAYNVKIERLEWNKLSPPVETKSVRKIRYSGHACTADKMSISP